MVSQIFRLLMMSAALFLPSSLAGIYALRYPFFLEGETIRPQLNQAGGLPPNAEGVAVLVQRITPCVVKLITVH